MRYGLIGGRLGHSWSPQIHRELGGYAYGLYEVAEDALPALLAQGDWGGLNVTIPYKRAVLPYCARLSAAARETGSVNTLRFTASGIEGHNTDCDGFFYLARRAGISFAGRKTLILGTGGTARTAAYCAGRLGASALVMISRHGENHYGNLHLHRDAQVIVNATPVGMYPENGASPISLEAFPACTGVLDVVYNPLRTTLVQQALARGIPAAGGLPMLAAQAAAAARLFTGEAIAAARVEEVLQKIHAQCENIVLIGMPGCGKTRVGKALAAHSGRPLLDTDCLVEEAAGVDIPTLLRTRGEAQLRALEREAVARAARESGAVIATGGGSILLAENCRALSQNGRVYFLTRPLSRLSTQGRPLSRDLAALYEARLPLYRAAADLTIENEGAPEDTARAIWEAHHAFARA